MSRSTRRRRRIRTVVIQIAIIVVFLLLWEYLPRVPGITNVIPFADPYFISSPSRIALTLWRLTTGADGSVLIWPYLLTTLIASLGGVLIGMASGALVGIWLSNSPSWNEVLRPFIVALNAVPRIALIPVFIIILGPTLNATMLTAITVVFFIVFFNAYEGGRTVPREILNNTRVLGANKSQLMWRVRWRFVLAWTIASLPNAVSLGLISVVTAEILTGTAGMGRLIVNSVTTVDASVTFAVVVILSIVGVILVGAAALVEKKWQHWWNPREVE